MADKGGAEGTGRRQAGVTHAVGRGRKKKKQQQKKGGDLHSPALKKKKIHQETKKPRM